MRLPTRSASGAFRRPRITAPPISPRGIFASRTGGVSGPGAGFLSLSCRFRTRRSATLHDTDERPPHRVARTRRGISRFVRETSGLELLSSSIPRENPRRFLLLFFFGNSPSSGGTRRPRGPESVSSRVATTCCFSDSANDRGTVRHTRRGRTPQCPCGGADLSRTPKDDARACRRTDGRCSRTTGPSETRRVP